MAAAVHRCRACIATRWKFSFSLLLLLALRCVFCVPHLITLDIKFYMVLLLMTVGESSACKNFVDVSSSYFSIGNRIKYLPNDRQRRFNMIFFFPSSKSGTEIPTLRVKNWLSCATFDWMVAGPTVLVNSCTNGCSQDSIFIYMRDNEKVRNNDVFGCPRRSMEMLAIFLIKIANKLIHDSPANLSLTAWWASAAGCIGGNAHVSGVRCGGTRNTCPGLYNGYDEYNALAVE